MKENNNFTIDKTTYFANDCLWLFLEVKGGEMKRVNQYVFYQMGSKLHPLSEIREDSKLIDIVWDLYHAREWLRRILNDTLITVVVSRNAAQSLLSVIDEVIPQNISYFSTIGNEKILDWYQWYRINSGIKEFETVFAAELPTFDAYLVSKKGIYTTADLVERAEMAIDISVRNVIPQNAMNDFNQAGRCLAFGLSTAAGFHTMRAVEVVLRCYWMLIVKPSDVKKQPAMAQCISQLRENGEDLKLMDILDHIRDLHRNTVMHPEVFLEMKDALRQFDIAKSAISAMGERIDTLKTIQKSSLASAASAIGTLLPNK